MLHLCVDARMINNSGIGVYIFNYIKRILIIGNYKLSILGRKEELEIYFREYKDWDLIEMNSKIYSISEQIELFIKVPKCDVFWSPHYNVPLLPINAKKRICSIPDIFHYVNKYNQGLLKKTYVDLVMGHAFKKSDKIITISDFSKKEIESFFPRYIHKVVRVYLGLDSNFFKKNINDENKRRVVFTYGLPKKFILYVGNVKPHKNLSNLLQSLEILIQKDVDTKLVIVGKKDGFITGDPKLFKEIENNESLKGRIIFTGYIPFDDLPILYSIATVFVFPSYYEGFGFPPLEAMACECPVIASNSASIPEVCGDAVVYVNPKEPKQIAEALYNVLNNKSLQHKLINKGKLQCLSFDWNLSTKEFTEIIDSL